MQFVDGENLAGILKRDGPLPADRASSVVEQIATALDEAHGRGLVHRDVKPANVLVEGERCYVADFGLTKLTDASAATLSGDLLGTLSYAAPEQIEGAAVDRRADVYALGATAYECVVGRTPFAHRTGAALLYAQLTESPPRPTDRRPELPAAVNAVLAKALAKAPADRYATCGELAAAFTEALSGSEPAVVAPPPPDGIPLPPALARCRAHPLIGRERELDEIAAVERGIVAIAGEPGIGKTRLVAELAARAHARGATVLYGRADEDPVIPYEPFVEALRHLCAHLDVAGLPEEAGALAPLVPELAYLRAPPPTGEAGSDRYRMFEAVVRVLAHAGRAAPIVLVLEDLQWADRPTLLLLRHVVESTLPAVIVTYRPLWVGDDHPLTDVLTALGRRHELRHVALAGLSDDETGRLAASRLGAEPDGELIAALVARTSGNPLFVEEILRDSAGDDATTALPETVRHLVRRRLERLSQPTRRVLAVAALLHDEFSAATLAAVAGDDVDDALDEALAAHVLVDHGDRYALAHSLIRDVLIAGTPSGERRRAHLRIAQALERRHAEPAVLARHFAAARANEQAARYSVEAARAASRAHGHEQAAALLAQAVELLDGREDVTLLLELGDARLRASQPRCVETFRAAVAVARETGDAGALAEAALGLAGRFTWIADAADANALEEALHALDPADSSLRVRVLARLAPAVPADRARQLSDEALAMAERLDDDSARLAALAGQHAAWRDDLARRAEIGREWVALADRTGELEAAALARHWRLLDLVQTGDRAGAERELALLVELAGRLHQPLYEHCALVWQAVFADLDGRDAETITARGVAVAEQMRIPEPREQFTREVALRTRASQL
jgi:hypothetical protein